MHLLNGDFFFNIINFIRVFALHLINRRTRVINMRFLPQRLVVICIIDEHYTPSTTVKRVLDLRIKQIRL